ncbi:MAG: NYN domain-containing protein [Sandaracinus sp.]|nr:NYN domain-containing protein [Sandaracinus sp.]
MGRNYTYVDNSNLFIEGQRVSAVHQKMFGAETLYDAIRHRIVDHRWQLDYGSLYAIACGEPSQIGAAYLWGSPPPGDSFWKMVERFGFQVTTFDKSRSGKEKKVDVALAHQMTKDAYSGLIERGEDELTLVAGDKDYVPVVEDLVGAGFPVHVVFWSHAAVELQTAASSFTPLDPYLDSLTKKWAPLQP